MCHAGSHNCAVSATNTASMAIATKRGKGCKVGGVLAGMQQQDKLQQAQSLVAAQQEQLTSLRQQLAAACKDRDRLRLARSTAELPEQLSTRSQTIRDSHDDADSIFSDESARAHTKIAAMTKQVCCLPCLNNELVWLHAARRHQRSYCVPAGHKHTSHAVTSTVTALNALQMGGLRQALYKSQQQCAKHQAHIEQQKRDAIATSAALGDARSRCRAHAAKADDLTAQLQQALAALAVAGVQAPEAIGSAANATAEALAQVGGKHVRSAIDLVSWTADCAA